MSDEQSESLAAQMGAWVPPWERRRDEPDREFQDAVDAPQDIPGQEPEPTEIEVEPEIPVPDPIEEAPEPREPATPVDDPGAYLAGFQDAAAAVAEITPVVVPAQAAAPEAVERSLDDAELTAALEAILLVVDEPTSELKLAEVTEQPVERVTRLLDDVSARYTAAGHGFDLRRAAGGWRLYTRPEYAAYVERFVLDGQSVRLTQAALETLAVVAYKQPVTRSRISAIRGVNCDGVMRTLVTRGLIEEVGTEPETGAYLYRTTSLFLEKLGLNSVDQLPPLAPFLPDDVEEVLDASG
ncbi:RNA 3-phosphate cyclase [Actinoplanes sp. SE50]|uniref:SMC-Scp complex subunit ScpB n=1 Tax=unclassified Actinoplanes TaxID=2626549 RepID=UPI00023ECD83|nr:MULTISPECIES: SMC-Scp complex subunit ScpB [unclassified Actinoplanes]AEV87204.1 Segregation and condensation protein B [Actinoplanes sp. SE50/110]ATO85605.1 RNA 3-phosphate cyclase [Actinoplanes sp. SE50]SLM03018.1 SMC-Scp complex subunit ScpB [Actinoplanes sp. SE50/110]